MQFITSAGVKLSFVKIERQEIDDFRAEHPLPVPPQVEIEVWGGTEMVPNLDDNDFLLNLADHMMSLHLEYSKLILPYVTAHSSNELRKVKKDFDEMIRMEVLDIEDNQELMFLAFGILSENDDLRNLVDEMLYHSTVTPRGIQEAIDRFKVSWGDLPVMSYRPPDGMASSTDLFEHRQAAKYSLVPWVDFCELSGPEQAEIVVFRRMELRLAWLRDRKK